LRFSKLTATLLAVLILLLLVQRSASNIRARVLDRAASSIKAADKITKKLPPLKKSQQTQNQRLQTKVKILEARLAQLQELSRENTRLRELVGFRKKISYKTIPAKVMGRDPSNWNNIVFIDKGASSGMNIDTGVTSAKGLVGRVIEAGEAASKVMLIEDPDSRIAARVQRTRASGLVAGTLSHRCRMIYISPDADVKIGDMVVTAGTSSTFPEGLLIGKITDIFEDKGGLYLSAIIKPAADLERLEEVLCIK